MKRRFTGQLIVLAVLCAVVLVLTNTWARQGSAFEQLDLLVDVRHELINGYVEEPDKEAMSRAAVQGMIESLDDPYTTYLAPEDLEMFEHQVRGSFSGIGAEVDIYQNRVRIVTPLEDSPAWEAGVMAGDIILEIEGESTLDMPLTQAVRKLTGEPGTDVNIRVRHESGEEEDITITRDKINIQTVRGFRREPDRDYDFTLDDEQRIGYVRLTQFSERSPQELREALEPLSQGDDAIRALVLDMRFNPGGLLQAAVQVSDMFLKADQTIVSVKGRKVPEEVHRATAETLLPSIPVVVLANEASASAAEIVTGALKDNDRALFVGSRTFGKGSVQQVKMLESGQGALKMTNAYYYIPSGRLIHRKEDAKVWGVDPSKGSYVPMSSDETQAMLEARREKERLTRDKDNGDAAAVSPAWIKQTLKDPQLAAALRAARGKLNSGDWPEVGKRGADQLAQARQRSRLRERREALMEQLNEVERQLGQYERGNGESGESGEADDSSDATQTNGAATQPAEAP